MARTLVRKFRQILKFGPLWLLDSLWNRTQRWSWQSGVGEEMRGNSSLSDGTKYVSVCKAAFEDDVIYSRYKSCSDYREILEHCDYPLGLDYLALIEDKEILYNLQVIAKKDGGRPAKFHFPGLGRVSPTQIRYAKVTQDLNFLFGDIDNFVVTEVGVGFGGQALHLCTLFNVSQYNLVDLEWPAKLALKNIINFDAHLAENVQAVEMDKVIHSDLFISNYAFSELSRNVQNTYIRNIISQSPRGYLIFNYIHDVGSNSLTAEEFMAFLPEGAEVMEERPLTYPGNVLIVWGHNQNLPNHLFSKVMN